MLKIFDFGAKRLLTNKIIRFFFNTDNTTEKKFQFISAWSSIFLCMLQFHSKRKRFRKVADQYHCGDQIQINNCGKVSKGWKYDDSQSLFDLFVIKIWSPIISQRKIDLPDQEKSVNSLEKRERKKERRIEVQSRERKRNASSPPTDACYTQSQYLQLGTYSPNF